MKKTLLLLFLFTFTGIFAQGPFQPSQFNNVCDDDNDGFAQFFMQEISSEIIGNTTTSLTVSHHLTQSDAANNLNPLGTTYTNVVNPQTIFARVLNLSTNQVQIIAYNLTVNPLPIATPITITECYNNGTTNATFNLTNASQIIWNQNQSNPNSQQILFHETQADAFNGTNAIPNNTYTANTNQETIYYSVQNIQTGCFSVSSVTLLSQSCNNPLCPTPTNTYISYSNSNTAVIGWLELGSATQWEININNSANSIVTTTNPYVLDLTNYQCNLDLLIKIRSICSTTEISNWSYPEYAYYACPQAGQPESYSECIDVGGQACFNLTDNDVNLMGTLDSTQHIITYHASNNEAVSNVNPLSSPYCVGIGINNPVYARITNTSGAGYQTSIFFLHVRNFVNATASLQTMIQCDDNNDSVVTFDLTSIQAQINTTNSLQYYSNESDAVNSQNPIANPSAFIVSLPSNTLTIYIRESISNYCDIIYNFQLIATGVCNLASNCIQANSLCNALGTPFVNSINTNVTEPGANYGCLGSHPNPTWFYMPISQAGSLNLIIQQSTSINFASSNLDVDFIAYGPFTSPTTPCYSQLTTNNIVDCSYSAASIENVDIPNVQAGQYYLIMVTNYSNQTGYIKINEVAGSTAQIDCSGFRLNAFLDSNNNGTQDTGESNFPLGQFHYEINSNGNVHDIITPTGIYSIYESNASNSYDLSYTIDPAYLAMYNLSTSSYNNVSIVAGGGMVTYNFPITVVQTYNDVAAYIIPVNAPRPGFTYTNKIVYGNLGNQTVASGTLSFSKDANVVINSISQAGTTPTTNGFTYNYSNLLPFEYRIVDVVMNVPNLPTVQLGQLLTNSVSITPITGDIVPINNVNSLSQVVIGSYDPNDKMESRGNQILHSSFTTEDFLYYTIRFENTGTASAINVRINDVLNSQLDESTVRMVYSSHPYVLDQVNNNLTWIFDNIQLPASVANTNIGKGYITFRVKPMPGYAVGDIIPNAANIYFDFNPAVVTNTFNSEFIAPLAVNTFNESNVSLYPNPATTELTISLANTNEVLSSVRIVDVLGKQVVNLSKIDAVSKSINVSNLTNGIYFIEIETQNKTITKQKIVIKN